MPSARIRLYRRLLVPVTLLAILIPGFVLRSLHLDDVAARTPDERAYIQFGHDAWRSGTQAVAGQFAAYVQLNGAWDFPPPVHIGHTFLVAVTMFLWDSASPGSVVGLSFACSVLSLALLARIGFRFFTPLTALAAVFFLATSASELGIGRRVWQDAVFGFFSLLLFYFSLELLRDSRRWWPQLGFFVIGAWCILMKQNGLIVYALSALAVFLTILFRDRAVQRSLLFAASFIASLGVAAWLLVLCGGGAEVTWAAVKLSLQYAPGAARYNENCCAGPWWQLPWTIFLLNPVTALLALLGLTTIGGWRGAYVGLTLVWVLAVLGFMTLAPLPQNLRLLSPISGAIALLAGCGFSQVVARARRFRQYARLALIATMLLAGYFEYQHFVRISVHYATPDLGAIQVLGILTE